MIKAALVGVMTIAAVIAGEMGADKVLAMRQSHSTAAATKATEARKTHEINVPRIKDGAIKGYAVMLLELHRRLERAQDGGDGAGFDPGR